MTTTPNNWESFAKDTIRLMVDLANNSKIERNSNPTEINLGSSLAYYEAILMIIDQANAFEIPLEILGLDRFNPEHELLG